MSETPSEIHRLHVEEHDRFVRFLLAVAAAGIAFALHETRGERLEIAHAPVGVAILCWAASFAVGVSGLGGRRKVVRLILERLRLEQGLAAPPVPGAPVDMAAAALGELIEAEGKRVARRLRWQPWLVLAGGALFVAGHVWAMARI